MENWPNTHTKINLLIMGLLTILFFIPAFADEDSEEVIESVTIIVAHQWWQVPPNRIPPLCYSRALRHRSHR